MKKQIYKDKCLFAYAVRVGRAINDLWAGNGVQENLIEGIISFEMKNCQNFFRWKNLLKTFYRFIVLNQVVFNTFVVDLRAESFYLSDTKIYFCA